MGSKPPRKPAATKQKPQRASSSLLVPGLAIGAAVVGAVLVGRFLAQPRYTKVETNSAVTLPASRAPLPITPIVEPEVQAHAQYAGSQSCRACHAELFDQWAKSNHGLAERPWRDDLDKAAFQPTQSFTHGTQTSEARITDGKPQLLTLGFDNKREPYPIERAIGHDPLRQYLVQAFRGRLQTLEVAFDPHQHEWFNIYGNEDRRPGEWGHWTGRGMTWNTMCASCHNTRVRKNYDERTDTFHTTMAEMTVSCESCHGPMKKHAEWRAQYPDKTLADPTITKHTPDQKLDTCAMCHARRTELTGDFKPGDNFYDHHALAIVDETDLYYPDGQVRDEDYEFASFLSSKMHAAGVRCLDCHNPHTAKTIATGNALCMRCHVGSTPQFPKAPVINILAHTFHQAESTGSQCINCHMPQTTYMQRHPRHDHGFTIPDPLLTKELGIPNACNKCHTDKDVDWSIAAVEKWYGPRMERPTRQRTRTIAAARRGATSAREGLLGLLRSETETGYWKAAAVRLLEPWIADPQVQQAVTAQSNHADALVRSNVARSLEGALAAQRASLDALLHDPTRSVRVAAAWSLRAQLELSTQQGRELLHSLDLNADQPSGQMQKGAFEFSRNNPTAGLAHFEKAVLWDANSAGIRHELAVAYSMAGRTQDALRQLQVAVQLEPRQAEFHFKLALAWNELGNASETLKELEQTVQLDPRHARAWFNLGLARHGKGDSAGAIAALQRGEEASPTDASIPYARATIHAQLGQREQAAAAARLALQIQPQYQEALLLMQSLAR
ncbi:MAG: tetratricopeptide repeat protein [Roseimicrobium sp.]